MIYTIFLKSSAAHHNRLMQTPPPPADLANSSTGSGADWDGARVTLNLGTGVFTWVRTVWNYSDANATFRYPTNLNGLKRPSDCPEDGGPCKEFAGNRYFLQGAKGALDSPGEWWVNSSSSTLFIWMPDGSKPSDGRIAVKVRDYCVAHEGSPATHARTLLPPRPSSRLAGDQPAGPEPTRIQNLSFHGCTFQLLDCTNCIVSNVEALYPTYDPSAANGMDAVPATTMVEGQNATVERLHLAYSNNAGLFLVGSNHHASELLIESTDWLGSLAFPPIKIGFSIHKPATRATVLQPQAEATGAADGTNTSHRLGVPAGVGNVLSKVTVRGFGNSGIVTSQLANDVSYAHVFDGGLVGGDDACIHADNSPVPCSLAPGSGANCSKNWHHNWVHNCREKCVRCDDGSMGCNVHHNVVFNCGMPLHNGAPAGILIKGDGNTIWANTIFNVSAGQGDLVAITEFGQNKHSSFFNVAARRIGTRGGPAPATNASCVFAGGLITGFNATTLRLENSAGFEFQPTEGSPLQHAGVVHLPFQPPGSSGQHPDAGAYQSADRWTPGCTFHPRCFRS